jgi:SIR2-like domain
MAEPPYGLIAQSLREGHVIPLLGAGVNFGMRPAGAVYDETESSFLPTGPELSRVLARRCSFPSKEEMDIADLAKVSSYFVDTSARKRLRERLRKVFNRDYEPCDIHTYLASVAAPLLIITTNYDDLTERAFRNAGRPFDLVVHPTDRKDVEASVLWWRHGQSQPEAVPPNQLFVDLDKTTVIYKMHGTIDRVGGDWDSYVITEDDYVDFLARMTSQTAVPSLFMCHLRMRHFLFLGYGLRDWNLRVVLKNLKGLLPGGSAVFEDEEDDLVSWAIQYRPSELEVELWRSRRVKIYDVDINEFVKRLGEEGA